MSPVAAAASTEWGPCPRGPAQWLPWCHVSPWLWKWGPWPLTDLPDPLLSTTLPLADLCSPYLVQSVPQLSAALLLFVHTCHLGVSPTVAQPLTYTDGFLCPHPSLFPDLRLTLGLSSVICPSHLSLGVCLT